MANGVLLIKKSFDIFPSTVARNFQRVGNSQVDWSEGKRGVQERELKHINIRD